MSVATTELHKRLLRALEPARAYNSLQEKPLLVDLQGAPRLRVYAYNLVGPSVRRPGDYKINLRLRGQPVGQYATFDTSGDRRVCVVGYRDDLDLFVLWIGGEHRRFKNGGNVQVSVDTIEKAAAGGYAEQWRRMESGESELVVACRPSLFREQVLNKTS